MMNVQPKSGCGLGTLPGYIFILFNTPAVIKKASFEQRGMLHQNQSFWKKNKIVKTL